MPWAGKMPGRWQTVRAKWLFTKMDRPVHLGDEVVTCFRDGAVTLRKNRRETGYTESLKEIGYQGVRRGDLVIHTMDAFAGACGVSDSDGKSTPVYSVCAPKDGATNARYYAYCVREMARNRWILALSRGVRERSTDFRFAAFGDQLVPVPSGPEQSAIVRFLDHADRRIQRCIRGKERLIGLLKEQKQAIIHQAVTGQIDVRTSQPYPAYKDSGVEWLGEVPEHWQVVPLKRVSRRIQNGSTPPTGEKAFNENGTVPWYTPPSITDSEEVRPSAKHVTEQACSEGVVRVVRGPALLVVVIGTVGRMALMLRDGSTNQQITAFQLPRESISSPFVLRQLRFASRWLQASASAATIAIVDSGLLARLPCALPPVDEQHLIDRGLSEVNGSKGSTGRSAIAVRKSTSSTNTAPA